MSHRGPDATVCWQLSDVFVGQTIQNFSGNIDSYQDNHGFVFNGEIYNWQELGGQINDTALVKDFVQNKSYSELEKLVGPWAWINVYQDALEFATDPQYEKHLFYYQDSDLQIVCSEIAPILRYVCPNIQLQTFSTKHYPIVDSTPFAGIRKAQPGLLYRDCVPVFELDSIYNWCYNSTHTHTQAVEELDRLLEQQIASMVPKEPYSLSYSGGLDSSLLQTYLPSAETVTIATSKDILSQTISTDQRLFLDEKIWAEYFVELSSKLQLPMLSWSLVGWYAVTKNQNNRILFNGNGADELFAGYKNYLQDQTRSPYSDNSCANTELKKHIERLNLSNSLNGLNLLDYTVMCGCVDVLGIDLVGGFNSVEVRSPFIDKHIIGFALSLKQSSKIGRNTKLVLRDLYRARTGKEYTEPKSGFVGHCNDSIPYINNKYSYSDLDRYTEWRQFILDYFSDISNKHTTT